MTAWIYIRLFLTLAIAGWFFWLVYGAVTSGVANAAGRKYRQYQSNGLFWLTVCVQFVWGVFFLLMAVMTFLTAGKPIPLK